MLPLSRCKTAGIAVGFELWTNCQGDPMKCWIQHKTVMTNNKVQMPIAFFVKMIAIPIKKSTGPLLLIELVLLVQGIFLVRTQQHMLLFYYPCILKVRHVPFCFHYHEDHTHLSNRKKRVLYNPKACYPN